jgi:hypothetical protein
MTTCPISGSCSSQAHCLPFCLSSLCLPKVHTEITPCPSPLLQCAYSTPSPLLCASVQFLVYCSVFFILWVGQSSQGEYMMLGAHLLVCWMSPKQVWTWCLAGVVFFFFFIFSFWWDWGLNSGLHTCKAGVQPLEPNFQSLVSGGMGTLLFSQCNMEWRSFVWARGFRVLKFWFLFVLFFCQVLLQHLSIIFDLQSSHCLLLHSSCHLGPNQGIYLGKYLYISREDKIFKSLMKFTV